MTKSEAIKWADSRPRSYGYQYHVIRFNKGYSVISDSHRKKHPNMEIIYSTSGTYQLNL